MLNMIKDNSTLLMGLFAVLVLIVSTTYCLYCYKNRSRTETFSENAKKQLLFFKASWCGHCQRFQPVWDEFKSDYASVPSSIELKEYDVDEEESKPLLEKHNVRGFPTVILASEGNDDVVFTKNRTKEDLLSFCKEHA